MPEYRCQYHKGGSYFFTVVTHQRQKILLNEDVRAVLKVSISEVQEKMPFMIHSNNVDTLREFLMNGTLGRFSPTMSVKDAMDVCESMKEDVTLIYVGNEGIRYGRLFICGTPGIAFESNPINRIGVDFWTRQTTKLLEEIPWYKPLGKMSRREVYTLLRKMEVPFFERVHHWRDGTSFSEEISIGHIPLTIISF